MEVIPVLDVARGQVVAAVKGARATYLPIDTPLAPSHDPVVIAKALRALHPFRPASRPRDDSRDRFGDAGEYRRAQGDC
jgi:hypothetical protein